MTGEPITVADLLDVAASERGDALAAVFPAERATFAELAERSRTMARRMCATGLVAGDRVGLLLHGSLDLLAALTAAVRFGAIPVPINARYKARELEHVVGHSGMRLLLADPEARPLLDEAGAAGRCRVVLLGHDPFAEETDPEAAPRDPHGRALMLYTSGTTALPKGCVHTHASQVAQARSFAERLALTREDRFWTPLPPFHIGGIATFLATLHAQCAFVHPRVFEAGVALDGLEAERATVAFPAFETIWLAVLGHPRFAEADLSALRLVVNVGVPGRLRLMQEQVHWAPQVSATGGTESGGFLCLGEADDPLEARVSTCGRPIPGMEVRVVDPESGADLPPGQPGELLYRGVSRFLEYHRDPEHTARVIDAEGWFHSEDVVVADGEGRLAFVGRLKDMLKVGGENVAAAEIESFLAEHPAVQIVQVVSAPDDRYVEVPAAYVELRAGATATEAELIEFCLGRIATFKVPRYVRFVEEWPMSGTKIRKVELRERIAAELDAAGVREAPKLAVAAS